MERQPKVVTDDHWKLIDEHERSAGEGAGRPRVKLTSVAELLRVGGTADDDRARDEPVRSQPIRHG